MLFSFDLEASVRATDPAEATPMELLMARRRMHCGDSFHSLTGHFSCCLQ